MTRMVRIITGSLRHCVCSRRCSWKTSRWTAGPRPQQRWTAIITIIDLENLKAILIVNWVLVNLEKEVDEQNVEHILEWYENTVKNSLQLWDTVDCLERSEKQKEFLLQTFWIHDQLSYHHLMIIAIVMMIMKMITTITVILIMVITWAPSAAWWLWAFALPRFCWKRKKLRTQKSRQKLCFWVRRSSFFVSWASFMQKSLFACFLFIALKNICFLFFSFTVLQQFRLKKNKLTNWYCNMGKQGIWFCLLEFMLVQWVACFGIRDLKQDSWGLAFSFFFWAFLWERGRGEHSSFHSIVGKGFHMLSPSVASFQVKFFPLFVNRGHCCVLLRLSRMDRSL